MDAEVCFFTECYHGTVGCGNSSGIGDRFFAEEVQVFDGVFVVEADVELFSASECVGVVAFNGWFNAFVEFVVLGVEGDVSTVEEISEDGACGQYIDGCFVFDFGSGAMETGGLEGGGDEFVCLEGC